MIAVAHPNPLHPSQYNRCKCGAPKSAKATMCAQCRYPRVLAGKAPDDRYVACGCGRERQLPELKCAVCRGLAPGACEGMMVDGQRRRGGPSGCDTEWVHGHCLNCGHSCASNWPLCQECDSAWCLIRRHAGAELGRQSHGDCDRIIPGKARHKMVLSG